MIISDKSKWLYGYWFLKQEEIDQINKNAEKVNQCKLLLEHYRNDSTSLTKKLSKILLD